MSYRAHVIAFGQIDGKARGLIGHKQLAEMTGIGSGGTRHGIPGIWVERETKSSFQNAVWAIVDKLEKLGLDSRVYVTNHPSLLAVSYFTGYPDKLRGLRGIQRG